MIFENETWDNKSQWKIQVKNIFILYYVKHSSQTWESSKRKLDLSTVFRTFSGVKIRREKINQIFSPQWKTKKRDPKITLAVFRQNSPKVGSLIPNNSVRFTSNLCGTIWVVTVCYLNTTIYNIGLQTPREFLWTEKTVQQLSCKNHRFIENVIQFVVNLAIECVVF